MGTVFQIPWTYITRETLGEKNTNIPAWPESGMCKLGSMGFKIASMALRNDTVDIFDDRLKREEKLAIVLGTEGDGLGVSTIEMSDYTVKIPMYHGVDSLNVAAASAVAFW